MKMKKVILLAVSILGGLLSVNAQRSLPDALKAIDQERYDLAVSILLPLTKGGADPKMLDQRAEALYHLGDVYVQTNELDSASYYFEEGIKIDPSFVLNYVGRGKIDLLNGKTAQADATFDQAITKLGKTKDYRPYLEIARAYYLYAKETKDLVAVEKALNYEESAKKFGSKVARVYVTFGSIYLLKRDANSAMANFNRALDYDKNYLSAYVARAEIYRNAQNIGAAVEPLEEAIKIDPSYAPAYRELAELYSESGQYQKAVDIYKNKYLPIVGSSCGTNTRYSQFLFLAHEYKDAYEVIKKLMQTCDVKPVMYRLLGYSAFEIGKMTEAQQAMESFFQKQVDTSRIYASDYYYMAKILVAEKKDSLAYFYISEAHKRNAENALDLFSEIGRNNYADKRYKAAITAFDKIFEHGGELTPADYQRYGWAAYADSSYAKADTAYSRLIRMSPTFLPAYFQHARVLNNYDVTGEKGLAKADYEKVIELGETDTVKYRIQLIEAYKYMANQSVHYEKNVDEAIMFYEKVLVLRPTDEEAKQNIDILRKLKKKP